MSALQQYFPAGSLSRDQWQVWIDQSIPGWEHGRLAIANFGFTKRSRSSTEFTLPPGNVEYIILPLDGITNIRTSRGRSWDLSRDQVQGAGYFASPPDVAYLGAGDGAIINGTGSVAVASALVPNTGALPSSFLPREDVEVLLRGAGPSTRQVHNLGTPGVLDAQRLIVCEVLTPAGNWSSYPPHKHDEFIAGHESNLAEIYYFDAAATPNRSVQHTAGDVSTGLFHSYSSPVVDISIAHQVFPGDVALVPGGYHGPAVSAPEWDMYYLNVMVGPDPMRAWLISDDPSYAWIRDEWEQQPTDPRLPYLQVK